VGVKRAIGALFVLLAVTVAAHAYSVTRRERLYRQLVTQGDQALARGDTFAALSAFTGAIAQKPDSMLGYLKRGDAYRRRGELEASAADLEAARKLDGTEPRTLELLGDVASARQMYDQAAEYYRAYVALDDRPRLLYKLGLARQLAGRHQEAIEALRQAVRLDSRFAEAHYLLGLSLRALKQLPAAESALSRAVAVSPNLLRAREQLAEVYRLLGKRTERRKQLEQLLLADASAPRQVTLALAYADAGQVPRAVRLLGVASRLYPDHAGTYLALGQLWLDVAASGRDPVALEKAIEALQHAVSMDASSEALTLLGRARLLASDAATAERTLRQATETLPVETSAFLALADAAERTGHIRVARNALVDYQKLTGSDDVRFLVRVAQAHWRSGDRAAARATLRAVFAKDPDNAPARALEQRVR
jgi:tetratricopeptide (TPR) repeat protein